ncbi:hypothetical protein VKT23_010361 [Stygiomarasmius scandens]|uniref:Cytochrome P450 n=1 Tax=Marasmiellus scandens TaxID=2682957 RepID=A0ABR1JE30_9AGAR
MGLNIFSPWLLLGGFIVLFLLQRLIEFWKFTRLMRGNPGYRTVLSQRTIFGNLFPAIPGVTPGMNSNFLNKHKIFQYYGNDVIVNVSAFPCEPFVNIADPAIVKEVTSSRARFPKPVRQYTVLTFFGKNIVVSEGEEWKKYRKISAPAFSDRNNKLVWDESIRIMMDMFENIWGAQDTIVADHCVDITLPIALFVIGVAGFGRKISWKEDLVVPPGHKMTFKDALHEVTIGVFTKALFPKWAMNMTERLRKVQLAFDELDQYMMEMIANRRNAEKKEERYDLFSSLLDANDEESPDGEAKLTERELIGNIFIFLVAGHETTAHTLCYTFGLLALYPDEQEKLYQQIKSLTPNGRLPAYEEMPLFTQSMAVFYETLRLFPPVNAIPKYSAEDTVFNTVNHAGERVAIPVPKGTNLMLNTPALHYNPRYWKDPEEFNPDRFLGDWPREAFVPFSVGARACIGRKFFETEGIAILTTLVSKYKIEVKEEPQFARETFEERKARIFATRPGITLTPVRMPLVFKRRD